MSSRGMQSLHFREWHFDEIQLIESPTATSVCSSLVLEGFALFLFGSKTMPSPSKSKLRSSNNGNDAMKARIFLFVACLWPLWVLALFAASATNQERNGIRKTAKEAVVDAAKQMVDPVNVRNMLDRVDVMGYGPTHPRLGIVIVGGGASSDVDNTEEMESLVNTVESVYRTTDLNRIFLICVVVDGSKDDPDLVKSMEQIDAGIDVPHWHGLRPDIHMNSDGQNKNSSNGGGEEDDPHGRKIHVMFNEERQGVTASRQDAAEFISLLARKHEKAGLKSSLEDIILLLLESGAQITNRKWLAPVTSALIVPPPILGKEDSTVAMKLANAVTFQLEGPDMGKRISFDEKFAPLTSDPTASDISLSSGMSYSTPVVNGAAIALRLDTFLHLPAQDPTLMDAWPANLELSLNLWLCADGIDMIQDVEVTKPMDSTPMVPLEPELAARFAAAWMEERFAQRFFQAYSTKITRLDWETLVAKARESYSFPKDLPKRCRSFQWFAEEVNNDFAKVLEQVVPDEEVAVKPPPPPVKMAQERVAAAGVDAIPEKPNAMEKKQTPKDQVQQASEAKKDEPTQRKAKAEDQELDIPKREEVATKEDKAKQQEVVAETDPKGEEKPKPQQQEPLEEEVQHQQQQRQAEELPQQEGLPENLGESKKVKPSKPLCKECLEIVQRAEPIDTIWVDVSGGKKDHPHKGARDEDGNWGYVHDETALRRNPPALQYEGDPLKKACVKRDNNFRMLNERVFVDLDYDKTVAASGKRRDKLFCLVYTTDGGHAKIPSIRETWGSKCDGFMVGSNKTEVSIGAVDIPHEGPEEYQNIWQKVRSMWAYIYDNYYEKYDWFHIGGDDLFLIVENLRLYLESEEIRTASNGGIYLPDGSETKQVPLFLGRRMAYRGNMDDIFNSGGSGYTMNKAALKALVVDLMPNYFPHAHTFSEDTMIAKIFRKIGVYPYDTKDENGGERYMPFMPGHHWSYRPPEDVTKDWYSWYSINVKVGPDHCSPRSVAFHYVKGDSMKRLYALLYHLCPKAYMLI